VIALVTVPSALKIDAPMPEATAAAESTATETTEG
jgi:hypothetical protein